MKGKIDLYSIEVFTSAFAHYFLIRLQKSEKRKIKIRKIRSPILALSTLDLHHLLLFSSPATRDNKKNLWL
jgi:hypothetical protein